MNAQTISFETAEGYTLGDINFQENWVTTLDEAGGFVTNQVVSAERATNGMNSLKIAHEEIFGGRTDPFVGGFYMYPTPIPLATATFSADINIDSVQGFTGISFLMGLVSIAEGNYRTYINFGYDGHMDVLVRGTTPGTIIRADTQTMWVANTWYNVKIETQGPTVRFYLDGVVIYTGTLISTGPVDQFRFAHDNYEGSVYIDNFRTNSETLSVTDNDGSTFKYFYNKNNKSLNFNFADANATQLSIYNTIGQEIIRETSDTSIETVDLSKLSDGMYIVKVKRGETSESFKILKN